MYSILYVDDEPDLLEIGKIFIEQTGGFTVVTMESAEEALKSSAIGSCDAIVSDYLMPGMDGIDFLRQVRETLGDIPFILFTGRGREEVMIEAINNGADFYLQKGGDPTAQFAELTHKLRQAIRWRHAEEEKSITEKKFSEVFFKSPILSSIVSLDDGIYRDVNTAFLENSGYAREEVIGRAFRDLPLFADPGDLEKVVRAAREGKEIRNLEMGLRTKSGEIRQMLLSQDILQTGDDRLVFSQAIDITGRKQAQDELRAATEQITASEEELRDQYEELAKSERTSRESEAKFRAFFEKSHDPLILSTRDGIADCNEEAIRLFGYTSRDEFLHLDVSDISPHVQPDGQISADSRGNHIDRAIREGKDHFEWVHRRKDGSTFPAEQFLSAFTLEDRSIILASVRDISPRKEAEDELRFAYEQLTASNEELNSQYEEIMASEQRLRESEERFRMLLETLQDAVLILDFTGTYLYANTAALHFAGLPDSTQPAGYSIGKFLDPSSVPQAAADLEQVRTTGGPVTGEYRIRTVTDELRWVEGTGVKISYLGNDADLVTLRDTTERRKAEEAIKESELKYRTIFENTGTATILIEEDTTISLANSGFEHLSGYPRKEIENKKKWTDFVVREDLDRMIALHRERRKQGPSVLRHYEFRFRQRSGAIRSIYITVDMIPGTTRSIASMQDITERKQAEEKLVAANNEYTNLLNQIQDVYYRSDKDGRLIRASRSLTELLGYVDLNEIIGRDIAGTCYFHPEGRKPLLDALAKNGKVTEFEITLRHRNGTPVLAATSTHYYYDKDGTILGVEGTIRDITERRKTENALLESRRQLENAMDLARVASWEYDVATREFIFTDRLYALMATTAEKQKGMRMSSDRFIQRFVHPDDTERFRDSLRETVAATDARYSSKMDFRLMRSDGEIRTLNARYGVIMGAGGTVARMYGAVQDVTESEIMEQAVREANRKLNLLNSITRHDMVNQLTLLKGYAQLAEMKKPDQAITDFLVKIKSAATMIERQLAFTKTYQELGIKAPAWFDLRHIVDSTGRKEARFSKTCDATEIFADPMIEKVFYNLFDNAIRHGKKVTEIAIQCERGAGELIISVEDNGCGVPAREKEKIFEKGYGKNTGFGLFLAKEILLLTGITIRETGIPGEGARFEMHVPRGMYRFAGKHH